MDYFFNLLPFPVIEKKLSRYAICELFHVFTKNYFNFNFNLQIIDLTNNFLRTAAERSGILVERWRGENEVGMK